MKSKTSSYCPNCHYPLPKKARFCTQCGQKPDGGLMSVGALLRQVWYRVLHLESRSLRYMWLLFIPGYVSVEYFKGRQKRYPQPIRFFFIVAFLFLFTLKYTVNFGGFQAEQRESGLVFRAKPGAGSTKFNFFEIGRQKAEYLTLRQQFDSLPEELRLPLVQKALDTLLQRTYGESARLFDTILAGSLDSTQTGSVDSLPINLGLKSIRIATADVFRLDADAIIARYKVDNWMDKAALRQGLKTIQDPGALMNAYLGSLGWTILALVAFLSVVLRWLFRRQRPFYVEHFIFLLNEHTSIFLILIVALLIHALAPMGILFWSAPGLWFVVSPVLAMKRFYQQNWGATLLKSSIFGVAYLVGFVLLLNIAIMVVFLLF